MQISNSSIKKVIKDNFDMQGERITVSVEGSHYFAKSKKQGLNAEILKQDKDWENTLINHIKWQCRHLVCK